MKFLPFILVILRCSFLMRYTGRTGSLIGQIPWVARYVKSLPGFGTDLKRFRTFAMQKFLLRKKGGSGIKDLFYHLVKSSNYATLRFLIFFVPCTSIRLTKQGLRRNQSPLRSHSQTPLSLSLEVSDKLCIVHKTTSSSFLLGSDTTATVLSSLFFYLLRDPKKFEQLRAEVDRFYPRGEEITVKRFGDMDYLDACVNEALRLSPPLPSGSPRRALHPDPSCGKMLGP